MTGCAAALLLAVCAQAPADAGEQAAPPAALAPAPAPVRRAVIVTSDPTRSPDFEALAKAIDRMRKAAGKLADFTATFQRQEYKGGPLPAETMSLKFRAAPRSVYLRWGTGKSAQEVVWRRGWNADRLRAHPGSFPDFTVNLPTDHWLAMRGARHGVDNAGFDFTIEMFARDLVTVRAKPSCVTAVSDQGAEDVLGAPSRCFAMETDKDACPELYAFRARLCMHEALGVPTKVQVWDREDGAVRLVEDYAYGDIQVDVGLSDKDFDPANPDYSF